MGSDFQPDPTIDPPLQRKPLLISSDLNRLTNLYEMFDFVMQSDAACKPMATVCSCLFWNEKNKADVLFVQVLQVHSRVAVSKHLIIFTIASTYGDLLHPNTGESREVNKRPGGRVLNAQANAIWDYWFVNM